MSTMLINGEVRDYLRDSGSMVNLCKSNMVSMDDLLPEHVWIKQPLDATCKCLPLVRVVIEGDFGKVITKAVDKSAKVSQGFYLMENRTAKLIE